MTSQLMRITESIRRAQARIRHNNSVRAANRLAAAPIDFFRIPSPMVFQGNPKLAYRDPAAFYHNGTFHRFFSLMEIEPDGAALLVHRRRPQRRPASLDPTAQAHPTQPQPELFA